MALLGADGLADDRRVAAERFDESTMVAAYENLYGRALYGRRPDPRAPERLRRRGLHLWPYILAGAFSFVGVAAAGLPPALGLLPVIPAIAIAFLITGCIGVGAEEAALKRLRGNGAAAKTAQLKGLSDALAVRDAEAPRIDGFPYLRVDRLTATFRHAFSDNVSIRNLTRWQRVGQYSQTSAPQGVFCLASGLQPIAVGARVAKRQHDGRGPVVLVEQGVQGARV